MASSLFSNQQRPNSKLELFKQMISGKDPQKLVENLVNTGKISRQQFDSLGKRATEILRLFRKQ